MQLPFDNTYARLPPRFYARVAPSKAPSPRVLKVNRALAEMLRLDADALASPDGAAVLSGNTVPEGAEAIALAYAGHQFGGFVPQLGDGRAILLGEVVGTDGRRRDVQLKGAGRTPFSRGGDGRAALGPVLREYVVSEAMAALGIPTTRSLAAVATGGVVMRDEPLPGAVLTRVAASHLRVGTFEYFAARDDREALAALTRYALERHFPDALGSEHEAAALLDHVVDAQASLVACWMGVGFIHGVMNTDNTAISGETLDYGPCAFLDEYDPMKRFSSIDTGGRYAFARQPAILQWNLTRLAEALLPLFAPDEERAIAVATDHLARYPARFGDAYAAVMRAKLGLTGDDPDDLKLVADLLTRMAAQRVDFTVFFRALCEAAEADDAGAAAACFTEPEAFQPWADAWRARLAKEPRTPPERAAAMRRANPARIPRNHQVEAMIEAAVRRDDYAPFEALLRALEHPYDDAPEFDWLRTPPETHERVRATFCGT